MERLAVARGRIGAVLDQIGDAPQSSHCYTRTQQGGKSRRDYEVCAVACLRFEFFLLSDPAAGTFTHISFLSALHYALYGAVTVARSTHGMESSRVRRYILSNVNYFSSFGESVSAT